MKLKSIALSSGFRIHLTSFVRDPIGEDFVLLDMIGDKQAVRANWAALTKKKIFNYTFGGAAKLQKHPGHIVFKESLPNEVVNWTFVSKQAIPELLHPDASTFMWKEIDDDTKDDIPPETFFPIFQATMPFPTLEKWSSYLWNKGLEYQLIQPLTDSWGVKAWRITPRRPKWHDVIKDAFLDGELSLVDNHIPQVTLPTEEELNRRFEITTFPLGRIVTTPGIMNRVEEENLNILPFIERHTNCDWSDMGSRDQQSNKEALYNETRIFSSYNYTRPDESKDKIWVITEADRSSTCVLLPEEY